MLRFCGFDLELLVDDVISREDWPALCEAHDEAGAHWLIVQVDGDRDHPAWLCAPVSVRAIRAVLDGQASPYDVLRHSATGTVELVRVAAGRAIPDRCLLCSEVDERLSSPARRPGGAGPGGAGSDGEGPAGAASGGAGPGVGVPAGAASSPGSAGRPGRPGRAVLAA